MEDALGSASRGRQVLAEIAIGSDYQFIGRQRGHVAVRLAPYAHTTIDGIVVGRAAATVRAGAIHGGAVGARAGVVRNSQIMIGCCADDCTQHGWIYHNR